MAWVTKENIDSKKAAIKALNQKYGVKATLSGTNDHSMNLTIASGKIDFIDNYCKTITKNKFYMNDLCHVIAHTKKNAFIGVNHYYLDSAFSDTALEYLQKATAIMQLGNHDNSDVQTDYFDVGWYISVQVGRWNKPYKLEV